MHGGVDDGLGLWLWLGSHLGLRLSNGLHCSLRLCLHGDLSLSLGGRSDSLGCLLTAGSLPDTHAQTYTQDGGGSEGIGKG